MAGLTLHFVVQEDMPSERKQDYRQLVIDGLRALLPKATPERRQMIDRMFWDCERTAEQAAELGVRSAKAIDDGP